MSDSSIFLPSESLQSLYAEMETEYENQVDLILDSPLTEDPTVLMASKEKFMEGFHSHTHRYQQMYLMLRDLNLLPNTLLDVNFMTVIITPGFEEGMMLPLIRQDDDLITVGFEHPPMNFNAEIGIEDDDFITVASIPLLPSDKPPYGGKSVLATGTTEDTEVILVMQERQSNKVIMMWGNYVLREVHRTSPTNPLDLN